MKSRNRLTRGDTLTLFAGARLSTRNPKRVAARCHGITGGSMCWIRYVIAGWLNKTMECEVTSCAI